MLKPYLIQRVCAVRRVDQWVLAAGALGIMPTPPLFASASPSNSFPTSPLLNLKEQKSRYLVWYFTTTLIFWEQSKSYSLQNNKLFTATTFWDRAFIFFSNKFMFTCSGRSLALPVGLVSSVIVGNRSADFDKDREWESDEGLFRKIPLEKNGFHLLLRRTTFC